MKKIELRLAGRAVTCLDIQFDFRMLYELSYCVNQPTEISRIMIRWTQQTLSFQKRNKTGYPAFVNASSLGKDVKLKTRMIYI